MADFSQAPSKNPADSEAGFAGALRLAFRKAALNTHGQLPAVVERYDAATNTATIRPLVMIVGTEGQEVLRASLARIPVLMLAGGDYVLRFPVRAGDTGWIEASDRDISLLMQSGVSADTKPGSSRVHNFSDGRFIPDAFRRAVVAGENSTRVTLQSLDGGTYVAIGDDGIHISGSTLIVNAPATFTAPVTMSAGATISGIPFASHTHPGVRSGPDSTGGPQ